LDPNPASVSALNPSKRGMDFNSATVTANITFPIVKFKFSLEDSTPFRRESDYKTLLFGTFEL
jgi:hypothetical protein